MQANSDEFKDFAKQLAIKLMINSPLTLWAALEPGKRPEGWIGTNAYWNQNTAVYLVPDDIHNSEAILVKYKTFSKLYRKHEIEKLCEKDVWIFAYEDLMKL